MKGSENLKPDEVLQKIIEFKKENDYEGFKVFVESIDDLSLLEMWDYSAKLMEIVHKRIYQS
jgi:hypothetical protein